MPHSDEPVEPYDICDAESSVRPDLPGEVEIGKNADHLLDVVSAELLIESERRAHRGEMFQLGVSGSDVIAKFMERMMYNPDMRSFPWDRTQCWLLDDTAGGERFGRLHSTLVPHSGIDEAHLHAATDAIDAPRFDYVLLDIGADGRVGGLQSTPADGDVRIEPAAINRSNFVALIGMGRQVHSMLQGLADAEDDALPVQQIRSTEGSTKWYLSMTTMEEDTRLYEE